MSLSVSKVDFNLDCPVCYNQILPPVFQCQNGHLICEDCLSNLQNCPVCREVLPAGRIRNLEMEKLVKKMNHQCPYEERGCKAWVPKGGIENHKYDCTFGSFKICSIIGLEDDCGKEVAYAKFGRHLEKKHDLEISVRPFGTGHKERFPLTDQHMERVVCVQHEGRQMFLVVKIARTGKQITWQCFILRGRAFASRCHFELQIRDSSKKVRISWSGPCLSLQRTKGELKESFSTFVRVLKGLAKRQKTKTL